MPLVREWREIVTEVSDHQSMATALQQSPFFPMFRDQIDGWVKRLATLQEALSSMAAVQRKWVYLEPIFARGALPNQATRFRQVQLTCEGGCDCACPTNWDMLNCLSQFDPPEKCVSVCHQPAMSLSDCQY